MPLKFSNWSWTQSESTVYINLPLRGAAAGKVDIVLTEDYLKVKTQSQFKTNSTFKSPPFRNGWVDGGSVLTRLFVMMVM